ncbi:unnamed protein product [Lactuca saligna]|uniref:Uncharacterized protein n=1 Tax=Lactuca saligna TaxID=75948 RepID=A0AA35YWG3_LACSI|nr:unnamed protein product [Lactuca saligna]
MLTPYKVSTMKTMILSYLLIRMKMLQTPTSFSHRRLVLFLMSVSWDDPGASKSNQISKPDNTSKQNQQPPTPSLINQKTHLMPKVYDTKLYDTKLKSQVIPDYIQIRYQGF